jgi:hypothetical protein
VVEVCGKAVNYAPVNLGRSPTIYEKYMGNNGNNFPIIGDW